MAITKAPFIRYKILDECFRNQFKSYLIEDLLNAVNTKLYELTGNPEGIKIRQLRDDIAFMRSEKGWSIQLADIKVGKKAILRYEDQDFSIFNAPLNDIEMDRFNGAIEVLSQFEGMPQFDGIQEIIAKLKNNLNSSHTIKPFIGFDSNQDLKGMEFFDQLYHAVQNKHVLEITYQDFKSDESYSFTFHPYYMKQYNNRWFIFGFNTAIGKANYNLAIDRIIRIVQCPDVFIENKIIDWQDYFSDMIGVTRLDDANTQEVILHFNQLTGQYMANKSIHETQKNKWIDHETLEVRIKVIINYELERLVLSYADSVMVIQPDTLKQKIKERLRNSVEQYD